MLSKEEIEKDNTFKISMPLITDEDIRKIDNNFENIVKEFTKSYVKEKDLVLAQYIMKKQQDKLDNLESDKQKLIEKLIELEHQEKIIEYAKEFIKENSEEFLCERDNGLPEHKFKYNTNSSDLIDILNGNY